MDLVLCDPPIRSAEGKGNPHAFIMATLREWDSEKRSWAPKTRKEYYVRNKDGCEAFMSPPELDARKADGWAKVFQYHGLEGVFTEEEARRVGLGPEDRISRSIKMNDWGSVERFMVWREAWTDEQNAFLRTFYEKEGVPEGSRSYVHRSYEERGVDRVPQQHLGATVARIEQRERERCEQEGREYTPVTEIAQFNVIAAEANRLGEEMQKLALERARLSAIEAGQGTLSES